MAAAGPVLPRRHRALCRLQRCLPLPAREDERAQGHGQGRQSQRQQGGQGAPAEVVLEARPPGGGRPRVASKLQEYHEEEQRPRHQREQPAQRQLRGGQRGKVAHAVLAKMASRRVANWPAQSGQQVVMVSWRSGWAWSTAESSGVTTRLPVTL